jgi:hypothetical protein
MNRLIGLMAAVAAIAGAADALAQATPPDTIQKADNTEVKGRITRLTSQNVVYTDSKGVSVTLKSADVSNVILGDSPGALLSAINAAAEQKVDKAATRFEDALKEIETKKLREWNKAPVFLHWGQFLADRKDVEAALAMIKRVRTECGDSFWRADSWRRSIEIAKAKGVELQKSVLEEMKSEPEPMSSEASMGLAELAFSRGQFDEALSTYQDIAGRSTSPAVDAAKAGVFRTLKTLKKNADLDSYSQRLLADPATPPSLQQAAGAWAAGSLLEKAGKDKAKIRAAIMAAGKAIAMGPPERREEAEDYVAALRVAAKGYAAFAAEATSAEHKQEYKARASGYLMEIVRAYRGTPWAEAAQLELTTLGVSEN